MVDPSNRRAFVVSPIGPKESDQRAAADRLLKHVIEPVCRELGLDVKRADQISTPGRITNQIAEELADADLVIADLTGLNTNVMYEVGVRHGLGLPIVQLAQEGTSLPFDVLDIRTIFFALDLDHVEEAKSNLLKQARDALDGKSIPLISVRRAATDHGTHEDHHKMMLGAIADAIQQISHSIGEAREEAQTYAQALYQAITTLEQTKNNEMGMQLIGQLMGQGMQNPGGLREFMKVVEEMGNKRTPTPGDPTPPKPPKRQRNRR